MLLLSTSAFAQFICDITERNSLYQQDFEFSGLAYHPAQGIFFLPINDPIPSFDDPTVSISIKGYPIGGEMDFDVEFLDEDGLLTGFDFEGITHLTGNYFALVEEDENKIYFLEYKPNSQQFKVLSGQNTNIISNGLGGISYDPNTGRLYLIDEYERKLYSAPIELPGQLLPDGSISVGMVQEPFTNSSVYLGNIIDLPFASGLFHLGQIYPANHQLANNMLVTYYDTSPKCPTTLAFPEVTRKIIELKISLDSNNDLAGLPKIKKVVDFNKIKTADGKVELKPQGIVAAGNKIYVASEWAGLSSYSKKSISDRCPNGDYYIHDEENYTYDGDNQICDHEEQICECVACPTSLRVNTNASKDDLSLSGLYESSESIETVVTNSSIADVIIRNSEVVDLKSDHIILNEGFKVEAGACLNAEIEPCVQ